MFSPLGWGKALHLFCALRPPPRTSLSENFPEGSGDIAVHTPGALVRLDLPKQVQKTPEGALGPRAQRRSREGLPLQSCFSDGGVDKIAAHVRFQQIQIEVEKISLRLNNKTSPN